MRTLIAFVLILAGGLSAQVDNEAQIRNDLASALMALQGSGQDMKQQADALFLQLLAVPETKHQPKKSTITTFARELVGGLAGRTLQRTAAAQMAEAIVGALRSAGVATSKFKDSISHFEKTLSDVGVNASVARALASKLRAVGEEVRGPEDLPVMPAKK